MNVEQDPGDDRRVQVPHAAVCIWRSRRPASQATVWRKVSMVKRT
jgi:hypothetical protein